MNRIRILGLMLLSALLCSASVGVADGLVEEQPAGVQSEDSVVAAGALSNYSFTLDPEGIPGLDGERSAFVVISDIHLGMDDLYAETQKNRAPLADFLQKLRRAPNIKELVIAGDLIDEWFIPADTETYAGKSQIEFAQAVAANNPDVVAAFNDIIRDGAIRVTYVPGNHDLLITSESIQTIFPGMAEARDVRGLGTYVPDSHPEIAIEHGHRYNFFCAPDPLSNQSIAPGSILPPGYFFTRIATLSVVEGKPEPSKIRPPVTPNSLGESQNLEYLYWRVWDALMTVLPIKEDFDEKIIQTRIDGFTEPYAMSDVMPRQAEPGGVIDVNLFSGIQDTWDERQALNRVAVPIPVRDALVKSASSAETDNQAVVQYFHNPESDTRIVVFGHSHEARIIPAETHDGKSAVYVNSGTWIDKNETPTMTFVVIIPKGDERHAGLYHYSPEGAITVMDTLALAGFADVVPASAASLPQLEPGQSIGIALGISAAPNFRDVGGYVTADGLTVARGLVYRSGVFYPMSPEAMKQLEPVGLKNVYDLRTTAEIQSKPDQIPPGAQRRHLNVLADSATAAPAHLDALMVEPMKANAELGEGRIEAQFIGGYREFITLPSARESYRVLFTSLADSRNLPAVFHCTGGKDRTGWATAALLTLLGVPRETVMQDYLRSNDYVLPQQAAVIESFVAGGGSRSIPVAIFGVKAEYLEAAFDEMETRYGGIEAYFSEGLGIDAATQTQLRNLFLEER